MEQPELKQNAQARMKKSLMKISDFFYSIKLLRCIRESLVMIVPVILVGAFALILKSLPIIGYEKFIQELFGGTVYLFLDCFVRASFGMMSVYLTISIALCFGNHFCNSRRDRFGVVFAAIFAFLLYSGVMQDEDLSVLGANGLFTAMVCGLVAAALFHFFQQRVRFGAKLYTNGADDNFQVMINMIAPIFLTMLIFLMGHCFIVFVFRQDCFHDMYVAVLRSCFHNMGSDFSSSVVYIFVTHFLWFFGIHGSNVLEEVSQEVFAPALDRNLQLIEAGQQATEIFSRNFFDVFVIMGGCGSTLCLILAILVFSKKTSTRSLAGLSIFPGLFNVNELVVFGLPIVFNPIYFIPFILTPLVFLVTSSLAMYMGIVPVVTHSVTWTTPILLGGYYATGSVSGALLQLVNLVIGMLIYRPFVLFADYSTAKDEKEKINRLVSVLQESEASRIPISLLDLTGENGLTVKNLANDLEALVGRKLPVLFYQPQYDHKGKCIGAEALLRWNHPLYGMIYPPLVFQLAQEMGILTKLEKEVFRSVIQDLDQVLQAVGEDAEISVNVTGITIQKDEYEDFLKHMQQTYPQYVGNIMLEITEQAALTIDESFIARLNRIKNMGYRLGIDDFSMGNTSIKYLQTNIFTLLKLDGGLSRDVMVNERSKGIVSSISQLTKELGIAILAEYVETEEQRQQLENMGVCLYQGYLYSPAVSLDKLLQLTSAATLAQDAKE